MDYNLYIVLQENDLETVGIFEIQANWEGENISYDPRRFESKDKVKMIFSEYKKAIITEGLIGKNTVFLKIADGLRELEMQVNKKPEALTSNNIIIMLQRVCKLDKFIIYIFEDDELIEQQIRYTNDKDILVLVSDALKWEAPKNIKIYCE